MDVRFCFCGWVLTSVGIIRMGLELSNKAFHRRQDFLVGSVVDFVFGCCAWFLWRETEWSSQSWVPSVGQLLSRGQELLGG